MKVAVIGGGWAGLSAAVTAVRQGHKVSLFEASATLGGRARTVRHAALGTTVDNGQHILLGAYTATLELMHSLGISIADSFHKLPLSVRSADGKLVIHALPYLPPPLHIAAGLLGARGLSWPEKNAALRIMHHLRQNDWQTPRAATVQEWLTLALQPSRLQHLLWKPLCVATMNTPVEQACAQLFANVLRDSLGASRREAGNMLIPRRGLSELWPTRVLELARKDGLDPEGKGTLEIITGNTVHTIHTKSDADATRSHAAHPAAGPRFMLDDHPQSFDAVVVCCNTPSAARLLASLPACPGSRGFLKDLQAFEHSPIATLTLLLEQAMSLPAPMLLLHEDRQRGHYGQWLFQGQGAERRLMHIVVSDAQALMSMDREKLASAMVEQLGEQLRHARLPPIGRRALIVEKRATFLAVPGLKRPANRTPWPGVWVAGDWTDTGYPAVLEGAVRSGRDAALQMDAQLQQRP